MGICKILSVCVCVCLCAGVAQAKHLGTFGATFDIMETDLVEEIKANIDLEKVAQAMDEYKKPYKPKDIQPLPLATADRTFYPDMKYTLDHDIHGKDGELLYRKGLTWNPLDFVTMPGGLVVINGEDNAQVEWFKASPYANNQAVKLLLSGGYATELREQLKRPVFYLTKPLATRMQLAAVPSVVVQEGRNMMVREVWIEPKAE